MDVIPRIGTSVFGVILSIFSRIRTENGEVLRISPYLVQIVGKYGPE